MFKDACLLIYRTFFVLEKCRPTLRIGL